MTRGEKIENLQTGHSIQGNKVFCSDGSLWGQYDSNETAVAVVEAFRSGFGRGYRNGKADGVESAKAAIRAAIGL